jgi:hypothetical protein
MKRKSHPRTRRTTDKSVLRLPDLEHAKLLLFIFILRIRKGQRSRFALGVTDRVRKDLACLPVHQEVVGQLLCIRHIEWHVRSVNPITIQLQGSANA